MIDRHANNAGGALLATAIYNAMVASGYRSPSFLLWTARLQQALNLCGEVLDYFVASSAAPLPKRLAKGMQLHIASSMSATHSDLGTFNANPAF